MKKTLLLIALLISEINYAQTFTLIKDSTYGHITDYTDLNNKTYYIYNDALWQTDGTQSGTTLVRQLYHSISSNFHYSLTNNNSQLFFIAYDDNGNSKKLWISDGTTNGTRIVGSNYKIVDVEDELTLFNNQVVFTAYDTTYGFELYISDGTDQGTHVIADLDYGINSPTYFYKLPRCVMNNYLYISQVDSTSDWYPHYDPKLWKSDGTANGTQWINDISVSSFMPCNNNLFFAAYKTDSVYQTIDEGLYKMDNSNAPLLLVPDIYSISDFKLLENKIVFCGQKDFNYSLKLFSIDTSGSSFAELSDTDFAPLVNGGLSYITDPLNGKVYLKAGESYSNNQLMETDGTLSGTYPVSLPASVTRISSPIVKDNKLFFQALDTSSKRVDLMSMNSQHQFSSILYPNTYQFPYSPLIVISFLDNSLHYYNHQIYLVNRYDSAVGRALYKVDMNPSGISEIYDSKNTLNIYPNPASTQLFIDEKNVRSVAIYDMTGKQILTTEKTVIDVQKLVPGLYEITATDTKGTTKIARFLKQ